MGIVLSLGAAKKYKKKNCTKEEPLPGQFLEKNLSTDR
jgi:hypothetical protein